MAHPKTVLKRANWAPELAGFSYFCPACGFSFKPLVSLRPIVFEYSPPDPTHGTHGTHDPGLAGRTHSTEEAD
jgi:hypothetical protein